MSAFRLSSVMCSSGGSGRDNTSNRRRRIGKNPGLFEVVDVSPPRQCLGIHALPPNTHNGDEIDVSGKSYVVQSVVLKYKLVHGKYRPDHRQLEVNNTGRFLMNRFLDSVFEMSGSSLDQED